jgi:subtilase family serine protease
MSLINRIAPLTVFIMAFVLGADAPVTRLAAAGPYSLIHAPPTTARCERIMHRACYSPRQLQTAYDMGPLYRAGLNGRRETIAVVESFGSPTIAADLKVFDQAFGLPAPPSLRIIHPAGRISPHNRGPGGREGWTIETSLDVEYAHAMAPGASILLVETPVDETLGLVGFPQMITSENYVIDHHLAQVISQSFGAAEQTFSSPRAILKERSAFRNARRHGVTVVAATGDEGPTSVSTMKPTYFEHRVVIWPASDPLVTAVGGTQLRLNASGGRVRADVAWNETAAAGAPWASGGGVSRVFPRPSYQRAVAGIVGIRRGLPDISMSAAKNGGALVYVTLPGSIPSGRFLTIAGTSEAAPLFAGIVAVADQAAHRSLGFLNPALYRLGAGSAPLPDITSGNTTVWFRQNRLRHTVKGFAAVRGYDLATGLGTVDGAKLVQALSGRRVG